MLLHGWPYDIHSFVDVAPIAGGCRATGSIVPLSARLRCAPASSRATTCRNGQQAAVALDIIALMDALKIQDSCHRRL